VRAAEVGAGSVDLLFLDDYFFLGDARRVVTTVVVVVVAEERRTVDGMCDAFT
jgi:hypothetical protein